MFPIAPYIAVLAVNPIFASLGAQNVEIASQSISLEDRYPVASVNEVFKYNILLALDYMADEFTLNPGESFAFHDQVLPEYKESVVKTTNAHFNAQDGFKSDGWLYGDGVCHLASLIHWTATNAGLKSVSLASHDFAPIPGISKKYGVSIKYMPGQASNSARQNLYVTNTLDNPVTFVFDQDGENLNLKILVSN